MKHKLYGIGIVGLVLVAVIVMRWDQGSAAESDASPVGTWRYFESGRGTTAILTLTSDHTVVYLDASDVRLGAWAIGASNTIDIIVERTNSDGSGEGYTFHFPVGDGGDLIEFDGGSLERVYPDPVDDEQLSPATPNVEG